MRVHGAALILVLLVLSALAIIGAPFVISMALHDKASLHFSGGVAARAAAEAARNHAMAHLEKTVYSSELEAEDEALDELRPGTAARAKTTRSKGSAGLRPRRGSSGRRGGIVRRRDLGEQAPPPQERDAARRARERLIDRAGSNNNDKDAKKPELPDRYRVSRAGPSARQYDLASELEPSLLDEVLLPEEGTTVVAGAARSGGAVAFRFQDPRGVTAAATVTDEQGKINLNTAPPNLLGALFGMSRLAEDLNPSDERLALEDASVFRGDADDRTLDGAVFIENADHVEAITYRRKAGNILEGCFRGAFFSGPSRSPIKRGTAVADLRGWKVAYHRLWAQAEGGFLTGELTRFRSVEAIREIANWQISSFFLSGIRGEGLTLELLQEAGWSPKKLSEIGLDPGLFSGSAPPDKAEEKVRFDDARRRLRKLGIQNALTERLKSWRGVRGVADLAARLEGADKATVERTVKSLETAMARDKRRQSELSPRYVAAVLKDLAEVYRTPGIETVGPEDLQWLREATTVDSHLPVEWLEAQAVVGDATEESLDRASVRLARTPSVNRHTVVRFQSLADAALVQLNVAGAGGPGGFTCLMPMSTPTLKAHEWTAQALARHSVNANTASKRVLAAVFLGLGAVSPLQANQLAQGLIGARPLKSHEELHAFFLAQEKAGAIEAGDAQRLFVNAVAPTSSQISVGTTGFVYASGDVYAIEARGLARSPAGTTVAEARFREVVEVSAARPLTLGLLTQADFAEGIYLRDARMAIGFPEDPSQFLLESPGTQGHLVASRPLLLPRVPLAVAGGDLSSLRLLATETSTRDRTFTVGTIEHFAETHEGWGLDVTESWPIDLSTQGGGANQPPAPAGGAGAPGAAGANVRLNMIPGGVEFWVRMQSLPTVRSVDGHVILFDAATEEEERNRIQLLLADRFGRILLRIYDASLRDPSVERTPENGQYLEVAAERALDLGTWYHFRAVWDGVFGGGAQLYIDGFPVGTDNLSTELVGGVPQNGGDSISVKDARKFPKQGVVRIDQELFEYDSRSGNSLRIRTEPNSTWKPIAQRPRLRQVLFAPIKLAGGVPGGGGGGDQGAGALQPGIAVFPGAEPAAAPQGQTPPVGPAPPSVDMSLQRAPGNRRGSTASTHTSGARVALHGYSLEVRRKIRQPANVQGQGGGNEYQVPDGDGATPVWGRGGLTSRGFLSAWHFPAGIQGICHYEPVGELAGSEVFIVPLFYQDGASETAPVLPSMVLATLPGVEPRNAIDYFQDRGVLVCDVGVFLYKKERQLPPQYVSGQATDQIAVPQTQGLRLLGSYPPAPGDQWLTRWNQQRRLWKDPDPFNPRGCAVFIDPTQRSLEAAGRIGGLYPPMGVLEVPGVPAPWEIGRQPRGGALFATHPDDAVEWIRYAELFEGPFAGEDFHLFVGRTGRQSSFRGYPERHSPALPLDYRKQLDHPPGQPLRLVMELSEGGAGWGDYVTIAGRNPASGQPIFEPGLRRVYKVLEHQDGRFFVSLIPVGDQGQESGGGIDLYRNTFTMAMSPRLVKFPTWGLPEIPAAGGLLFGDSLASDTQRGSSGQRLADLSEDEWPITIDEIRRLRTSQTQRDPRYTVRHVLVPLKGKSVDLVRGSNQGAYIRGTIPAELAVNPSSPLEVFVVTLSRERGGVSLFAQGVKEGLLRIGDELFFFEDLEGAGSGGANVGRAILGNAGNVQPPGNVPVLLTDNLRERDALERSTLVDQMAITGASGQFEPDGFARVQDNNVERQSFHEVFYYGRGFSQCLRGQFGTPIVPSGLVQNVTRRLRLTGRGLLGTRKAIHSLGEAVTLVPVSTFQTITGPVTPTGIPVKRAELFDKAGMILIDNGDAARPWEIVAHLGPGGEGLLKLPRDQRGRGVLRGRFGTPEMPLGQGSFAYELPHRYPDRFELEVESESLAYLQKTFRVPGAYWRSIEWLERPSATIRRKRSDVVIVARFDGQPDWDAKPTQAEGGLHVFEDQDPEREGRVKLPMERWADQLELRVYFRFPAGAFTRLPDGRISDDWKETAVLDGLWIEYEKAGAVVRHEELPF